MSKLISLSLPLALAALAACQSDDSERWRTDAETGLEYRLWHTDENAPKPMPGDVLVLKLEYGPEGGPALFSTRELPDLFRLRLEPPKHAGPSVDAGLALLRVGDSILFRVPADSFYRHNARQPLPPELPAGSTLLFRAELLASQTQEEYQEQLRAKEQQLRSEEMRLIDEFLALKKIEQEPSLSGLYFIPQGPAEGPLAKPGQTLEVHYEGSFLDGVVFDSSRRRAETFSFRLGAREVIDGWEEGFSKLAVGQKATLIVPSFLAYGKEGVEGVIPPYATLVFEVELISAR